MHFSHFSHRVVLKQQKMIEFQIIVSVLCFNHTLLPFLGLEVLLFLLQLWKERTKRMKESIARHHIQVLVKYDYFVGLCVWLQTSHENRRTLPFLCGCQVKYRSTTVWHLFSIRYLPVVLYVYFCFRWLSHFQRLSLSRFLRRAKSSVDCFISIENGDVIYETLKALLF